MSTDGLPPPLFEAVLHSPGMCKTAVAALPIEPTRPSFPVTGPNQMSEPSLKRVRNGADPALEKVQTVTGTIEPRQLGVTLTFEHLLTDPSASLTPPSEATARDIFFRPFSDEISGYVRYYGFQNLESMRLGSVSDAIEETLLFKQWGGASLVDGAVATAGRDPTGLARISRATGLNVIMTSGYRHGAGASSMVSGEIEDEMAGAIVDEFLDGVDGTGVKPGVISFAAGPSDGGADDVGVLRACGRAQRLTGAPLMVRPGVDDTHPLACLEVLSEIGVDLSRVIMAHMSERSRSTLRQTLASGCRVQLDGFGGDNAPFSPYLYADSLSAKAIPDGTASDRGLLDDIAWLVSEGYAGSLLMSHDIRAKHRLLKYGGHGYFYILANVVPRLRAGGFDESVITGIIVDNPRHALAMTAPTPG